MFKREREEKVLVLSQRISAKELSIDPDLAVC